MNQFQSFQEVLSALRRRAWLIVLVAVLGCLLSLRFAMTQETIYEATAVVQIEDGGLPDSLAGASAQDQDAARRVRLIEQRLMSRDNLVRIMEKHSLFADNPDMTMNERVFNMREAARIEEIRHGGDAYQASQSAPSGLMITVRLNDPQMAADLANELMDTVIAQSRSRSEGRARDTLSFFEQEAARVSAEIEAMEARIAEFKRQNADALPSGVLSMRDQLGTLRDADLQLDREIVTMETNSSRQREDVLARQIVLLREQKGLIAERIARIEANLNEAPEVERSLSGLERELTQLQEQYGVVTRRKAEAEMGQMLENRQQTDRFEALETALVPEVPASQSRRKLAIMGGVASLIAGVLAAFVAELANPAIRNAEQMQRMTGLQPVISVPVIRTGRDHSRRGLTLLAVLLATGGAIWAVMRFAAGRVPWQALLEKILPRAVQP